MIEKDGIEKILGPGGRKGAMTDILLKKIEESADSVFNEKDACRNYVYILQCRDNSLYTGWTNDIGKRLAAHNAGRGAKYTRGRGPVHLVHLEVFSSREEAMKREVAIKRLSAAKKRELIAGRRVKCCTGTEKTDPDREKITKYKK